MSASVRAKTLVGLLGAMALSGCASSPSQGLQGTGPGLEGSVESTMEPVPTGETSAEHGAIEGQVVNENAAPIGQAHVLLRGLGNTTKTDKLGRFAFGLVPAGTHTIRIDADTYKGYEANIEVAPGSVTRLNVTLVPVLDRGAGYREHLHDFWGDATSKILFDNVVDYPGSVASGGAQSTAMCIYYPHTGTTGVSSGGCPPVVPVVLPNDVIVYPGTRELEVSITWAKRDYVQEVKFRFIAANETKVHRAPMAFKPGETHRVPVEIGMTDHGHQRFSLWVFEIVTEPNVAGYKFSQGDFNRRFVGPFQVKIVAHKGVVPSEAPHAAYWDAGPTLLLADRLKTTVAGLPQVRDPKRTTACAATSPCFTLPAGVLVPPGTTRLDVLLEYRANTPAFEPLMGKKVVVFRTAAVRPETATWDEFRLDRPTTSVFGRAEWSLKLQPSEADAFYQKKSLWNVALANEGREKDDRFIEDCWNYVAGCGGSTYTLTITAVNEQWEAPPS